MQLKYQKLLKQIVGMSVVKQLIRAFPTDKRQVDSIYDYINVSEFFGPTIQGEGTTTGKLAVFLRLQGCHVKCTWCDSTEIWHSGNPYEYEELFKMLEDSGLMSKLKSGGYHFIVTGGSPLLQQHKLEKFFTEWLKKYQFLPYIEVENEGTIMPSLKLCGYVQQWNTSPKLRNCGVITEIRYKPDILTYLATFVNSTFKFVISDEKDWEEIMQDFIIPGYIKKNQVMLMAQGASSSELYLYQQMVAELAIEKGVMYSPREHINIWNNRVGI